VVLVIIEGYGRGRGGREVIVRGRRWIAWHLLALAKDPLGPRSHGRRGS
jgi:hypothetical protein